MDFSDSLLNFKQTNSELEINTDKISFPNSASSFSEKQNQNDTSSYFLIESLHSLNFPLNIKDEEEFYNSLLSPTNIRYNTIEWLIRCLDDNKFSVYEKLCEIFENYDRTEIFLIVFKNLGIEFEKSNSDSDYKKAIAGLSSNTDSETVLMNLINFVRIHQLSFKANTKEIVEKEIKDCEKIIKFMSDNKSAIFKENIRLFAPEIKIIEKKKICEIVDNKELETKINDYVKLISKLDNKLDKLQKLNLNYENVEMENLMELKQNIISFDKALDGFLKDYNQIYSRDLKYINEDKLSNLHLIVNEFLEKYNTVLNLANSLQEIFALHQRISSFNL